MRLIKRTIRFFIRYGGVWAPLNLIQWKIFKFKNNFLTKKNILKIDINSFEPVVQTKFSNLYVGERDDFLKISEGKRKILFYNYEDENRHFDIKTKWELKRYHHAPVLALYYEHNSSNQIELLFDKKKLSQILNNTNAMEVAISAINLITTYSLYIGKMNKKKGIIDENVKEHLKLCLAYIVSHYEKGIYFSGNHYFFNLLGVLWICESISGNKYTERLKKKTYKQLIALLKQIISGDGSLYEGSTYYHKYVTESLLLFLFEFDKKLVKSELHNYAQVMVDFSNRISINNKIVGIGDNDSGRILPLPSYFNYSSTDISLIQKLTKLLDLKNLIKTNYPQRIENDFGLYFLKNNNWIVAIRLEKGKREQRGVINSHCHNDQLHFTAFYNNKPLFVDSGVYSYISRNEYRISALKTSAHNTLQVNYLEQNQIFNDFRYPNRNAIGQILRYDEKHFSGEHTGFIQKGITHEREVFVENDILKITDHVKANKLGDKSEISIYYHVHPQYQVILSGENSAIIQDDKDSLLVSTTGIDSVSISNSYFSEEYGMKENNLELNFTCSVVKGEEHKMFSVMIQKES